MNSKDLLRALGNIDDKYLDEEYETPKEKNKKEFYMKIIKNKKIIYGLSSVCAVFILGVGILAVQKKSNNNMMKAENEGMVSSQNMNVMLEINPMQGASMAKLDADVETVEINTFTTDTATDDTSEITLQDNPEITTKEVKPEHTEPIIIANKATILVDELMADHNESLGETIANHKIEDIRQAINIGDRFRFQRELFNGNGEVMNKTIAYLNQLQKFEEAHSFLKAKFNWTADNNHAEDFLQIVKRRY